MRAFAVGLSLMGVAWLAGCGGATTVSGTVVHPAEVPVRSFPRVWIAGGHLDHELELLDSLAAHLRGGRAEVRRVELDDLEPMRVAGRIPPATVVLILDVRMEEATRPEWTTRPETVCGPMGCYTSNRSVVYEVPVLKARATLTVYEGPSARIQQRARAESLHEGRDYDVMRRRAVRDLKEKILAMVDQRREEVHVDLLEVDVPEVERAIGVIDQGNWSEGRRILDASWDTPTVQALDDEDKARVLYDIGQARRFDPSTLGDHDAHFAAAERAFRAALRHDRDEEIYAEALEALERHRRQVAVVRAQEEAAEHNYRMATPPRGVPPPPPSYQQ